MPFKLFSNNEHFTSTANRATPISLGYKDWTYTEPITTPEQFRETLKEDINYIIEQYILTSHEGDFYNAIIHGMGRQDKTLNAWEAAAGDIDERKNMLHLLVLRQEIHRYIDNVYAYFTENKNEGLYGPDGITHYFSSGIETEMGKLLEQTEKATRLIVDEILLFEKTTRLTELARNIPVMVKHALIKHSNPYSKEEHGKKYIGELANETKGLALKALHNDLEVTTPEGTFILDTGDEIYTDRAEFIYKGKPRVEPADATLMAKITGVRANIQGTYNGGKAYAEDGKSTSFIKSDFDNNTKVVATIHEGTMPENTETG